MAQNSMALRWSAEQRPPVKRTSVAPNNALRSQHRTARSTEDDYISANTASLQQNHEFRRRARAHGCVRIACAFRDMSGQPLTQTRCSLPFGFVEKTEVGVFAARRWSNHMKKDELPVVLLRNLSGESRRSR